MDAACKNGNELPFGRYDLLCGAHFAILTCSPVHYESKPISPTPHTPPHIWRSRAQPAFAYVSEAVFGPFAYVRQWCTDEAHRVKSNRLGLVSSRYALN